VTACVRVPADGGAREQHVTEFPTTVAGLLTLRDWLAAHAVTQITMEATGVFWKPVWAILEDEFELLLVNARHVKQVPGRKTDVSDAAWICQLAEAGLLRASFVPPKPIRALRNLTRYRKTREALEGRFDCLHAVWIGAILAHLDFLDEQIASLTETIGAQIAPFEKAVELLCTIPGVQRRTAEVIIAEIGVDMSVFPTAKELASWAGMCPGNDQSAGRRRSGKTRKGSKWLDWALEEAALAATRTNDVYLAAQYQRLRPRRGHKKALGAVKHSIIYACWHMLSTGELYNDLSGDYFRKRDPERTAKRLITQLEALGHTATLQHAVAA
jgi:transposase